MDQIKKKKMISCGLKISNSVGPGTGRGTAPLERGAVRAPPPCCRALRCWGRGERVESVGGRIPAAVVRPAEESPISSRWWRESSRWRWGGALRGSAAACGRGIRGPWGREFMRVVHCQELCQRAILAPDRESKISKSHAR